MNDEERIELMIAAAEQTNITIDFWDYLLEGLSSNDFRKVMSRASISPSYIKSNDRPYAFRSLRAPASPT